MDTNYVKGLPHALCGLLQIYVTIAHRAFCPACAALWRS
jgi:hypothetical protein